jgi:hypothetical protein
VVRALLGVRDLGDPVRVGAARRGVAADAVTIPPVWELVLTILATYALTGLIDHDRPLSSVWELLRAEVTAPRSRKQPRPVGLNATSVRLRENHVQTN